MSPQPTRLVVSTLVTVLVAGLVLLAPAATAAKNGPALRTSRAELSAAVTCSEAVGRTGRRPAVLLVHGTGTNTTETWSWNLQPKLLENGYAVCSVEIPRRAWDDLQTNVEYVVHAIRKTYRASGHKIAVIGHSQGAFVSSYALRVWPDLATKVKDFVGISGTYTHGSDTIAPLCLAGPCAPAAHQFTPGSHLLTEIAKHPLPRGPSYTGIMTLQDEIVTPQPTASTIRAPRARNFIIQDLCPTDVADHISILAEQPVHQLTFDALEHRGPARADRGGAVRCGIDIASAPGLAQLPSYGIGLLVGYATQLTINEPPLRAYWRWN